MTESIPATVLVADDDPNVREMTRRALSEAGIETVEAADGIEALSQFNAINPDLILLDVSMPRMSGLEVCQKIRSSALGKDVPIVIITGRGDSSAIENGFSAGATQYREKPLNWQLLAKDVQYCLRSSAAFRNLRRQEDRLRYLAYYDPLTSLPNRRCFNERLSEMIGNASQTGDGFSLMFIDLDHFKRINDSVGHELGDKLLIEIGQRLQNELRKDDVVGIKHSNLPESIEDGTNVSRLGGDEFTVLLPSVKDEAAAARVASRILERLSAPVELDGANPVVTPSIGISIFPNDGLTADELIRSADVAMFSAKEEGRACFKFHRASTSTDEALDKLHLEEELRDSLAKDLLDMHYQPQIDAGSGRVVGLEALVRWPHPERGMVSPMEFIPVAEESGQIVELGQWVMRRVVSDMKRWDKSECAAAGIRVCINVSPLQFSQSDLPDWIDTFLREAGMPADRIELELTESAIMADTHVNIEKLTRLKDMGLGLAVDDFGTGYSCLQYLTRFPIDTLKIDRSFVNDLASAEGAAIVDAIVSMAHALKLNIVAEGVEDEQQRAVLVRKGAHQLQGFHFARPIEASDVPEIVSKRFETSTVRAI
ncbi:histidine kinase [Halioglobus sp. HI00S01]|uniref:two-component system response regulator n=1 Tax=Halioglobus sp. HI00S01 TaxID=1822214 RepID=UPI0007C38BA8|nr:GGDEF domain-containing response regulator [Halioglobus sp. HI00S01]KZX57976.1 histidine kinase [Halioglobus sp. HI00S01]